MVFKDILSNAVEHNDTDAPQVTVTVEEHTDSVAVRIADNGPGIPEADRARLVEAGEQGPDSVGHGLGLYLVRTLVDRYDGDISIRANDPRGTVVEITLPRAT